MKSRSQFSITKSFCRWWTFSPPIQRNRNENENVPCTRKWKKQKNKKIPIVSLKNRHVRKGFTLYITWRHRKLLFFNGMVVWFYDLFCAKTVAWELACAVLRAKKLEKLILDGAVREKWNVSRFKGSMREKKCLVVWMCPSRASSKAFWACSPQFYYRLMTLKGCWRHGKTKNAWLH